MTLSIDASQSSAKQVLRSVWPLAVFLLLNLAAEAITRVSGGSRSFLFNLDFALGLLLYGELAAILSVAALRLTLLFLWFGLALSSDVLRSVAGSFLANSDPFSYLVFAHAWPWRFVGGVLAVIIGMAASSALLCKGHRGRSGAQWVLLSAALILLGLDIVGGHSSAHKLNVSTLPNIASSSMASSAELVLQRLRGGAKLTLTPITSETMASRVTAGAAPQNILAVTVESLGVLTDASAQQAVLAPLDNLLAADYVLSHSATHASLGNTITGELRELCAVWAQGARAQSEDVKLFRGCLPERLARAGYKTVAFHGNSGAFYTRDLIYPQAGFQSTVFRDQLERAGAKTCPRTFIGGVCDAEVYKAAVAQLQSPGRNFAHVMSLDSHLPLPAPESRDCVRTRERPNSRSLCAYIEAQQRTLTALAQAVEAAPIKPDLIIVYGDHAPPLTGGVGGQFNMAVVPYLEFTLRTNGSVVAAGDR